MKSLKFNCNNFDYKQYEYKETLSLTSHETKILQDIYNQNLLKNVEKWNFFALDFLLNRHIIRLAAINHSIRHFYKVVDPCVLFLHNDLEFNSILVIFQKREEIKTLEESESLVDSLSDRSDVTVHFLYKNNDLFFSRCDFIKYLDAFESSVHKDQKNMSARDKEISKFILKLIKSDLSSFRC